MVESQIFSKGVPGMKQYKEITVKKAMLDKVICNCCGKPIYEDQDGVHSEYLTIAKRWGYASPYDGEKHLADICPSCYQKWIETFVISPKEEFSPKEDFLP